MGEKNVEHFNCSVARTLTVIGERWTMLILREALVGTTRFVDFERMLKMPPDTLADRLSTLVYYGIMTRESYQEPGQRARYSYHLTPSGRELHAVIGAISDWGDGHLPRNEGPTMVRKSRRTGRQVHAGFIDEQGYEIHPDDVAIFAAGEPDADIAVTRPAEPETKAEAPQIEEPKLSVPKKRRKTPVSTSRRPKASST